MLTNDAPIIQLVVSMIVAAVGYLIHVLHDFIREKNKGGATSLLFYARERRESLLTTLIIALSLAFVLWDGKELNYSGALTLGYSADSFFRALLARYGQREEDAQDG